VVRGYADNLFLLSPYCSPFILVVNSGGYPPELPRRISSSALPQFTFWPQDGQSWFISTIAPQATHCHLSLHSLTPQDFWFSRFFLLSTISPSLHIHIEYLTAGGFWFTVTNISIDKIIQMIVKSPYQKSGGFST
jgi:hypothetical protein